MALHSIPEILAAAAGRKPWYDLWQSAIQHLKTHDDAIGNLEVGAAPGQFAPYDTRFWVTESGFASNAYTAALNPVATGQAMPTGYSFLFLPSTTNTGTTVTLDVGSTDGAVAVKKFDGASKADPAIGEIVAGKPVRLTFDGTHFVAAIQEIQEPPAAPTMQVFTASGTWTKPAGCRAVIVEVQGAGGGGGGAGSSGPRTGGHAGGGGYSRKLIDVSAIASATVVVGSGGAGDTGTGTGGAGGNSSWADGTHTVTGNGGAGGPGGSGDYPNGGAGGSASGGDINIPGGDGGAATSKTAGGSVLAPAHARIDGSTAQRHGANYGGGGLGGGVSNGDGGDGGDGVVIVTEFY